MSTSTQMEFNDEQQAAITCDARNLLVLAGAGTGKTRTIIGRAKHLVDVGVAAERIAIITFTRRAANELRVRLKKTAGTGAARVVTGTFHHLCLQIMSARRQWFGFDDLTVMDRDDQTQLMRLVRGELVGKNAIIPQAAQLISYYSYARNTNQPPQDYLHKFTGLDETTLQTVLKIFAAYRQRKKSGGYMDYDDILHRFAKVLHDDAHVRQKVCSKFEHLLVDEMQDTNPLQWLILESFAEHCHLFCVGDDAQSIYAFRGADFRNVHSFNERLPNSQTLKLEQNYRSTQPILDLANWLLSQSPLGYDKSLRSIRGIGNTPQLLDFATDLDEAEWIVQTIKQRHAQGASWSENMILCRTAYTARPIEAELIEQKVPYRFVGGMSLLQMAHVRDLLAVLRTAINYRDELAWMRYLTLWPRIGETTAARIIAQAVGQPDSASCLQALKEALAKRPEIYELPIQLQDVTRHPARAIQTAYKKLEPLLKGKHDNWDQRKRDCLLLERLAENHRSLAGFLETYTLDPISVSEVSASERPADGLVTLITVHSAKGTECEACFVAAAQAGNYPHIRSLEDNDAIEEERRVLYVALTRAKDELVLSRHISGGFGRSNWSHAESYFLRQLPAKLVDQQASFTASPHAWRQRASLNWDEDVIG